AQPPRAIEGSPPLYGRFFITRFCVFEVSPLNILPLRRLFFTIGILTYLQIVLETSTIKITEGLVSSTILKYVRIPITKKQSS
ncbi:MAG: hypothetical protein ACKPKO_61550, partial [Candidatus Fonsibacter sp.]